jgi:hypothetical protein
MNNELSAAGLADFYFQNRFHLNSPGDDMPMIRYVTTISSRQNNKIKKKSTGFL